MSDIKKEDSPKVVTAVVAKGCQVTGHDGKVAKAGHRVKLFDYEAKRYTERGFLVDKDGKLNTTAAPATRDEDGA